MTFSPERMRKVYDIQRGMHQKFRDVPKEGKMVEHLGAQFYVYPSVFWPSEDSKALIRNYVVNPNEEVCDVCTGSGVIALHSASKGSEKVMALDINPIAVECARENSTFHRLNNVVEVRQSDVFSAIRPEEQFDVITMNPPFTDHEAEKYDNAECTVWDTSLHVHRKFFEGLPRILKEGGRAYITNSNFGCLKEMRSLATKIGFSVKKIGENYVDDLRTFYAFELRRNRR